MRLAPRQQAAYCSTGCCISSGYTSWTHRLLCVACRMHYSRANSATCLTHCRRHRHRHCYRPATATATATAPVMLGAASRLLRCLRGPPPAAGSGGGGGGGRGRRGGRGGRATTVPARLVRAGPGHRGRQRPRTRRPGAAPARGSALRGRWWQRPRSPHAPRARTGGSSAVLVTMAGGVEGGTGNCHTVAGCAVRGVLPGLAARSDSALRSPSPC